jgi:hypothetical protein
MFDGERKDRAMATSDHQPGLGADATLGTLKKRPNEPSRQSGSKPRPKRDSAAKVA